MALAPLTPLAPLSMGEMANAVATMVGDAASGGSNYIDRMQNKFLSGLFGVQAITGIVGLILLIIGLVSLTRYGPQLVEHGRGAAEGAVGSAVGAGVKHAAKVGAALVA
jgi:hypothetical protein